MINSLNSVLVISCFYEDVTSTLMGPQWNIRFSCDVGSDPMRCGICECICKKKKIAVAAAVVVLTAGALLISGCSGNLTAASQMTASSQAVSSPAVQPVKPGEAIVQREAGVKYSVPEGVPILMYHMIGDLRNNASVMTPENLRWQMEYLKNNGYHPITMDELYNYVTQGAPLPSKPVCITCDDGYESSYTIMYPLLKKYHFPWTIFVITGQVGMANRVTWDQLREMAASHAVTIGNHTYSHPKMHELSSEGKRMEITRAQADLKKMLGVDCEWFCYPYGDYDEEIEGMLKEAGIKLATTTDAGQAKVGSYPYELKRVWIGNEVNMARYQERLTKENYSIIQ